MRLLYTIDKKDYDPLGLVFSRPSARGIIIKNKKIAMVYSKKYDHYKFPGGGIEKGESAVNALIREVLEETGLIVIENSVKEYGFVHRIQKGENEDIFLQDNYYFLCEVKENSTNQKLDEYERAEGFTLEFVFPKLAITKNRESAIKNEELATMLERENKVLELLIKEGYFN